MQEHSILRLLFLFYIGTSARSGSHNKLAKVHSMIDQMGRCAFLSWSYKIKHVMKIRFGFNFRLVHLHHKLATKKAVVKDVEFTEFTENYWTLIMNDAADQEEKLKEKFFKFQLAEMLRW